MLMLLTITESSQKPLLEQNKMLSTVVGNKLPQRKLVRTAAFDQYFDEYKRKYAI